MMLVGLTAKSYTTPSKRTAEAEYCCMTPKQNALNRLYMSISHLRVKENGGNKKQLL